MRSGEKEILNWILPFADTMIALFNLDPKELKKIQQKQYNKNGPYDLYVSQVVSPLVRQEYQALFT